MADIRPSLVAIFGILEKLYRDAEAFPLYNLLLSLD